ncbi:MAG: hypothetical protein Q4B45_10750 [Coriobacteriia bacterium]|nr:hypothetical protein [Coriobacteriia bacterium]
MAQMSRRGQFGCDHHSVQSLEGARALGAACLNTHGRERCHIDAIVETEKLARAYVMGVGR